MGNQQQQKNKTRLVLILKTIVKIRETITWTERSEKIYAQQKGTHEVP